MVNGIPQMQAMFRRKARKVMLAAREAAVQGGDEVASSMRYLAPREQGELVASIRVEQAASVSTQVGERDFIGVLVKAGDSTTVVTNKNGFQFQNAKIQEFGTQKMPANPFFFPAWRMNRARVRRRITSAIRRSWIKG